MSILCPSGHQSQTADYCDQCGAPIAGATALLPLVEEADTSPSARREPCPACGGPRSGDDRYCEGCGYDFVGLAAAPDGGATVSPPAPPATWEVTIVADRSQFERHGASGVTFPADYGERRFALLEGQNRIGRARGLPGEDAPEIDLAAPPADPGVSRLHAVLEQDEGGACVLRDLGSTNGTFLGDGSASIAPHTDVALADGDRIHLGAWTMITVHKP